MRIAILKTGHPPGALAESFGSYPDMFERLLAAPGRAFTVVDATGPLPEPGGFDAYVVTGSSAGVYDPLPWIEPLKAHLQAERGRTPMVGVCFGHQVMAEAFGGKVIKSPKGRGIGLQTYEVEAAASWTDPVARFSVPVSHGDQVVEPPPGAAVLAGSDFCPYAMLAYGEDAFTIQPHPEFEPAFATALIQERWEAADAERNQKAVESLKGPNDRAMVGGWIGRFLERSR
jgi:GMP synthase-like glutamine amidotransferase